MKKIGIIVGSLRKESYSRKVANHLTRLFPADYDVTMMEIGELPLYNQDYDDNNLVPAQYQTFRKQAIAQDAFLFVTPEYNRSVPGVLKNAIDVGSRPVSESVWKDKAAAIVSVSPGRLSAFGANHHLRQSLVFFNMSVVQQPEMYIGKVADLLDDNGTVVNERTVKFFAKFINHFVDFIDKHTSH